MGAAAATGGAGARGAVLLAVAVVLGIVLLQKFDTGGIDTTARVSSGATVAKTTSTTRRVGLTTVPLQVSSTTAKPRAKADVLVLVANGAGIPRLGAATTAVLKNLGYPTLTPTDATGNVDKTSIQFAEGFESEAREVAQTLSLPATVVARLSSPPVAAVDLGDAKVVVILGADSSTTSSTAGTTTTTRAVATSTTRP